VSAPYRSGFVALAGRPNVGKSTLLNRLVGEHVAAVSRTPQTTRRRALGAVNGPDHQLVLVDLPGFQRPIDRLTERMQRAVDEALADVDAVVFVLNAREPVGAGDRLIASRVLRPAGPPCVIAVNKVDAAGPAAVARTITAVAALGDFHSLHPISAKTGDGVPAMLADLVSLLPEGPRFFPEGTVSDQGPELRIGEAVREAALAHAREELPHAVAVVVDEIQPGLRSTRVIARVICETESQKGILIGARGAMVKQIGSEARPAVEAIVGGPVMLELTVRVRPHWRRDTGELDRLGV
jgi:GTP-binding protein Era